MLSRKVAPVVGLVLAVAAGACVAQDQDAGKLLEKATIGFEEALAKGAKEAGDGVPFHVELERDKGAVVWSIDVAQGKKTLNVVLDAATGKVVEKDLEDEDNSAAVEVAKVTLAAAVATALEKTPGKVIEAELELKGGKPVIAVKVAANGKVAKLKIDAASGALLAKAPDEKAEKEGPKFQDTFKVAKDEWSSTGSAPYFILEPGYVLVLEGKDEGKDTRLTITVLDETKTIQGVETRIVEEREEKNGKLVEVSRNYFAISKKTSSVYYFGEDVDIYEDGKVKSHEGAWLSGEKDARFGLMMPGTPVTGARFYQEVAPGVAMDRAEITAVDATLDTPVGKLEGCVSVVETTPLEKGRETKVHAPGIGLVKDGPLLLVRHGKAK